MRTFATKVYAMKKHILFIMNPISGTGNKAAIPGLIERFLDHDKFDYSIAKTEYAGHAEELARAAAQSADIIVAVGGDGTVNEVARAIVHTPAALGILPCGSGNGLARHLMLPMKAEGAIRVLNACDVRELDYGIVNGMPFFCTCGMGFDAYISKQFAQAGRRGLVTYAQKVLEAGLKFKPETYEITTEDGTQKHHAFLVSCANASQYGNNAYIAPQASMSDGLLDVVIMEPFGIVEAPQIAIDMFNKTLDRSSKIKTFKAKEVHIHRTGPGVIHCDGDPVTTDADVEVSLREKGIRVVVNPDAGDEVRKPNALQCAAADLFNEINVVKDGISAHGKRAVAFGKQMLKKIKP